MSLCCYSLDKHVTWMCDLFYKYYYFDECYHHACLLFACRCNKHCLLCRNNHSACKSLYQLCILFNQTEIRGIKWRKLSANPDYTTVDQLEDPVLVSYSKCIKADILSVWRRVARSSDQPRYTTDQLSYNKELWIFWYGDEPENLSRLISPDLRGTVT